MRTAALLTFIALFSIGCGSATAQATPTSTRSAVAGTWTLTLSGGRSYNVHLAGSDVALTGAWLGANSTDANGGAVTGEFSAGVVRLNLLYGSNAYPYNGSTFVLQLVDCALAANGNSASGSAYGYQGQVSAATMLRIAPPPAP